MAISTISKYTKIYFLFFIYSIIGFIFINKSDAQNLNEELIDNSKYEILRTQINIFGSYVSFSSIQKEMLNEADSLSSLGEYEIALIYLEEILQELNFNEGSDIAEPISKELNSLNDAENSSNNFSLTLISGIDFDRHEFEFGYLESDSSILEELNNPYTGLTLDYSFLNSKNNKLNLYNSVRYDKENIRDDYYLNFANKKFNLKYGGYLNISNNSNYSSYWENNFQFTFTKYINSDFKFLVRNNYNYKIFNKTDLNYTDYYRNYFESNFDYQYLKYNIFLSYLNEINEFLGNSNNDYKQNTINFGYRNLYNWHFRQSAIIEYEHRKYSLFYGDDLIENIYKQIGLLLDLEFNIYDPIKVHFENHFIKKTYNLESAFEPNYIWNYFKPSIKFDVLSSLQADLGYEWEFKAHSLIEDEGIKSTEQDYNSNGIFSSFNYFSYLSINFSISISYQWRRYPKTPTNELINLYSSRNILSLMAIGNFPFNNNLGINVFAVYDNDKDIDNDQGKTQSSIFNVELEYKF